MKRVVLALLMCGLQSEAFAAGKFVTVDIGYESLTAKGDAGEADLVIPGYAIGAGAHLNLGVTYLGVGVQISTLVGKKVEIVSGWEVTPGLELTSLPLEAGFAMKGGAGLFSLGAMYEYGISGKFTAESTVNGISLGKSSSPIDSFSRMGGVMRAAIGIGSITSGIFVKYYSSGEYKYKLASGTVYSQKFSGYIGGLTFAKNF